MFPRLSVPLVLAFVGSAASAQNCQWVMGTPGGIPALLETSLAYDSIRNRLVLFGGRSLTSPYPAVGETYEWDGSSWALKSTTGPAPRYGAGLAFDKARNVTVLYSGQSATSYVDTWEWDGVTWTDHTAGNVGVRIHPVMVFDSVRGNIVIYGGDGFTSGAAAEWNGTTWSNYATGGPIESHWYGTFNGATNRLFITSPSGTFELNGTTWQQVGGGTYYGLFTFDTVRNRVIAIGDLGLYEWTGSTFALVTSYLPGGAYSNFPIRMLGFDSTAGRGIAIRSTQTWLWNGGGTRELMFITQPPQTQIPALGGTASFSVGVNVPPPLTFQWYKETTALEDDGRITGSHTEHLTITNITESDYAAYTVVVTDECTSRSATSAIEHAATGTCYPNCDHSTVFPFLNANDFQCFLSSYAGGTPYGNCDGSTAPPLLSANDFQCFLNAFAAGCSAP